jgi:Patatin-like phospholipase
MAMSLVTKLPDEVFWAELEEIKRLRETRGVTDPEVGLRETAAFQDVPAEPSPAFATAVKAVEGVSAATARLREAENSLSWFARRRLGLAGRVSGLPGGRRLGQALEDNADRQALDAIERAQRDLEAVRVHAREVAQPSCKLGLVGLALSGGGIRSATVNLGILQVFAKHGLLNNVDYVSSVSGGGYVGATFSALLANDRANAAGPDFPLRHDRGKVESAAMKHLRRGASYLAPDGALDRVRIPALALRGLIVNLLLLLPYLLWAVVATHILWGADLDNAYVEKKLVLEDSPQIVRGLWITVGLGVLLVLWAVVLPLVRRLFWLRWNARNVEERSFALFSAIVAFTGLLSILPILVFHYHRTEVVWSLITSGWPGALITIIVPVLPLLLASGTPRVLETWRGRAMVYALGLLGPVIVVVLFLEITTWRIFGTNNSFVRSLCLDPAVRTACDPLWGDFLSVMQELFELTNPGFAALDWIIVVAGALLFLYGWYAVDVNVTALHGFYRDRISQAYLFNGETDTTAPKGKRAAMDELRLSDLAPTKSRSFYHLINTTLNLQASRQARRADFFLFSKRYIGSSLTDYCPTPDMERVDRRLNLGTAVAISGAALAPNMGSATSPALVFVMTLLNVRTGYWLPNPRKVMGRATTFRGVGPLFLLRELFGMLNENSRYVNVSDGGHIENLALYELIRRRCRFIIACDAEHDPECTFNGLAKLMQYARIDGSVDIDLDLDRLRKTAGGHSRGHWVVGKISYGDGEDGYLLYLKASLTGDEPEGIKAYCSQNAGFPHEPTSQQFFKEGQFEVYRDLGYHIACDVLWPSGPAASTIRGSGAG